MNHPILIRNHRAADLNTCRQLWNNLSDNDTSFLYKPLTQETFLSLFIHGRKGFESFFLVAEYRGKPAGFVGAQVSNDKAYLTAVVVEPALRRRGIGTQLLAETEKFAGEHFGITEMDVIFFNPAALAWVVPGTEGHDHPNAPGVDVASGGYLFLKNRGYRDMVYQNSYYLPLDEYKIPENLSQGEKNLSKEGISITEYDSRQHHGFSELFDNLESEDWREKIFANIEREEGGAPVMIVQKGGRIYGFAGPCMAEESGRGYFAGIGVHTEMRGKGAGKLLFARLCLKEQEVGARFMTFFTGENNQARNIYEAAGFKIVRTWADMNKVLHKQPKGEK